MDIAMWLFYSFFSLISSVVYKLLNTVYLDFYVINGNVHL